ncbi:MAG: hypothetical protein JRN09_07860 [Nitrososphaerota archaeon]|nr:hypothetical protein [Nitrososphaerota archaeon]
MASTNGFILGLIGGLLDFASASQLLLQQASSAGMMNEAPAYAWAGLLLVLGTAVVATALLSVISIGFRFARLFSILMMVYGVVMVVVGLVMSSGAVMTTEFSSVYSLGMVVVGAGMTVSGLMMSRSPIPM